MEWIQRIGFFEGSLERRSEFAAAPIVLLIYARLFRVGQLADDYSFLHGSPLDRQQR